MEIACLGPEQSFSHQALLRRGLKGEVRLVHPLETVLDQLDNGCELAILPYYNNTSNRHSDPFPALYAQLRESPIFVREVLRFPVHWFAMSHSPFDKAKAVYAHPQAPEQCKGWFERHPKLDRVEVGSTSMSADKANDDPVGIALAGGDLVGRHKFQFVEREVQCNPDNATWFLLVEREDRRRHLGECNTTGEERITLIVTHVGELPPRIEVKDNTIVDGRRFLELSGACTSESVRAAVAALEATSPSGPTKVLGCFPDYDRTGIAFRPRR